VDSTATANSIVETKRHYSAIVRIELVDAVAALNFLQELNFWPLLVLKSEAL
jgi:hypothetical protein